MVSPSQNKCTLGGGDGVGGVAQKRTRANKEGGGVSKLWNHERTYFLNVP